MNTGDLTRRGFLTNAASALSAPAFFPGLSLLSPKPDRQPTLVVVELFGGVDGLEVLVRHREDAYYRSRPTIAVPKSVLLPVDDDRGMPNWLSGMHALWSEGRIRFVDGVGYPNSSRSHFAARIVWGAAFPNHSGRANGWLTRLRDHLWPDDHRLELLSHVGPDLAPAMQSNGRPALSFDRPEGLDWIATSRGGPVAGADAPTEEEEIPDILRELRGAQSSASRLGPKLRGLIQSYEPSVPYPNTDFGQRLRTIAAMIQGGFGSRIYSVQHRSFDAHSIRLGRGSAVPGELDQAMHAFMRDLEGTSAFEDTLVLCHSEFGRALAENSARGCDHGAGGLMMLLGGKLQGGLYGRPPSLEELDPNGALVPNLDFRSVYAAVIEQWFGAKHEPVLLESLEVPELI